jgi:hypothetical protein
MAKPELLCNFSSKNSEQKSGYLCKRNHQVSQKAKGTEGDGGVVA